MLNQAAQKFIFTLEKITMGLGARPLYPPSPLWIRLGQVLHCASVFVHVSGPVTTGHVT